MNLHLNLSRVAAAAFRRLVGVTTPIAFTVPPSLGDPGTPLRRYTGLVNVPIPTARLVKDTTADNRARYVHTSVSHDTAHAANDEGDGRPTDLPLTVGTSVFATGDTFGVIADRDRVGDFYRLTGRNGDLGWFAAADIRPAAHR